MGYNTYLSGELNFSSTPSIEAWAEATRGDTFYFVREDTPEDSLNFYDLEGKFYSIDKDITSLVNELSQVGVQVTGEIIGVGEEMPDIWRLLVKDGKVTKEYVKMVWSDGTEYKG